MKYTIVMLCMLISAVPAWAGDIVQLIPYVGYSHYPYTPSISCQPGKPMANAVLVQAEQFWQVMCTSTKAGLKPLPPAAQRTAAVLMDSIMQLPESEKLGAEVQYLLGRIWLLNANHAEAVTAFMQAMVTDPKPQEYASALAVAFERQFKLLAADGQRQEMGLQVANQLSGRLLDLQTPTPTDYLMIGRIYYMSEVAASAEAILATGRTQFPQSGLLALAQALIELRMANPNGALQLLQISKGVPPELEATQRYLVGVAAWQNGKLDVAAQSLSEALKLNPKLSEARRLQKLIQTSVR